MEKKKSNKFVLTFLTVVIIAVLLMTGCGSLAVKSNENKKDYGNENLARNLFTVYYINDSNLFVPITYTVDGGANGKDLICYAVGKLLHSSKDDSLLTAIPEGTRLRNWHVTDSTVFLDFTEEFLEFDNREQAQQAVNSICFSLQEMPSINSVQFLVEGDVISHVKGVPVGKPVSKNLLNYLGSESPQHTFRVYYACPHTANMIPVTFSSEAEGDTLIKKSVEKLIAGPSTKELSAAVYPGTKLLKFSLNNGIAAVDLSEEAISNGTRTDFETMFIDALLLTLGQFPQVEAVQLLIEGEKLQTLSDEGHEKPLKTRIYPNIQP